MKKFNVEISGSATVTHETDTLAGLKKIAKRAQGNISVAEGNRETFFGTPTQLLDAIALAEEYGRDTLDK